MPRPARENIRPTGAWGSSSVKRLRNPRGDPVRTVPWKQTVPEYAQESLVSVKINIALPNEELSFSWYQSSEGPVTSW